MTETTGSVVRVQSLGVDFPTGRGETLRAVEDVSFDVSQGEILGIIGESGSGKSTLGRAVAMLIKPTHGTLQVEGRPVQRIDRKALRDFRSTVQMIFQDPSAALNPRKSIRWSVREPLEIAKVGTRAERNARVLELLSAVGLGAEFADRYPHQLSGGQKQRINIARALSLRPQLMICDEVVSALDVSIQADILNLFMRIRRELGIAFIFVTHDLAVVTHISDRVAVMYLGKFMELGPAGELHDNPLHPYTKALIASEPRPHALAEGEARRPPLEGEIPNPINPPSGCRFRTRCPIAQEVCAQAEPDWRRVRQDRWVRCHFVPPLDEVSIDVPA